MRTPYEYRDCADIPIITRRASAMRSAYIARGVTKLCNAGAIKVKAVIAALTAKLHHPGHHAHTGA